jgi:hypothetical protein
VRPRAILIVTTLTVGILPTASYARVGDRAVEAARDAVLHRLQPVRDELAAGGVGSAVRAAMRLARVDPVATQSATAAVLAPSQIALPPAVIDLLDQMVVAEAAADTAVTGPIADLVRASESLVNVSAARTRAGRPLRGAVTSEAATERYARVLDRTLDRSLLYSATLALARAIDGSLPELRSWTLSAPADSAGAAQCDVAEIGTMLCIGGDGTNTYTTDFDLQIDLGGNDVYRNNPASADPTVTRRTVAVAVDLAGNDAYETTLPRAESFVGQGAGENGGIGILVDAAGNDRYTTTVLTQPTAATVPRRVCAMGCGITGAGLLADLAGTDSYEHANRGPSAGGGGAVLGASYLDFEEANGLGAAYSGGLGALVDRGTGNDSYLEISAPEPRIVDGQLHGGQALSNGLGFSQTGAVALFADEGGTDTIVSRAVIDPGADHGVGQARGMGQGWSGDAAAITGAGDTTWLLSVENRRSAEGVVPSKAYNGGSIVITLANSAEGQGNGTTGGFGALFDEGGNDSFRAESEVDVRFEAVSESGERAKAKVAAGPVFVLSQGLGNVGTGALVDLGGNDTHVLGGTNAVDVSARDREPTSAGPSAEATAGQVLTVGQGATNSLAARGLLLDRDGDDVYRADGKSTTTALAVPTGNGPAEGISESGVTWTFTQAAAALGGSDARMVSLQDLGGTDTYRATAVSIPQATPPTKVTLPHPTFLVSYAQCVAAGPGLFLDSDEGKQDTFLAIPERAPQSGTRGEGTWSNGQCVGINR